MNPLPPIPIPTEQRWREWRIQAVPLVVFLAALAGVVALWRNYVAPPTLVGQVEILRENIASPKTGILAQMSVTNFQQVKAGQPAGQVIITDPKILASSLAVIQAEIKLMRLNLQPILGQQRLELNYDRARLDWMQQRVDLATTKVKLQLAENELRRTEELFKEHIVSEKVMQQVGSNKDKLQTEVEERTKLVEEHQKNLEAMGLVVSADAAASPAAASREQTMRAGIAVQEEKLH